MKGLGCGLGIVQYMKSGKLIMQQRKVVILYNGYLDSSN
jgi:hypothetical protein